MDFDKIKELGIESEDLQEILKLLDEMQSDYLERLEYAESSEERMQMEKQLDEIAKQYKLVKAELKKASGSKAQNKTEKLNIPVAAQLDDVKVSASSNDLSQEKKDKLAFKNDKLHEKELRKQVDQKKKESLQQQKEEKKEAYKPTVKKVVMTYVQAPLNVPSIVEKERKSFEEAYKPFNLPFEYSTITSGADQTAALASGDIQLLNCVGGSSVLISAAAGADIKILSVYANAPKAFRIFSKDANIKTPADLKGKTVAGPKGTILHELLAAYLKKGGLTMKDVNFVNMGLPAARAALESGKVDAALQAGPLA